MILKQKMRVVFCCGTGAGFDAGQGAARPFSPAQSVFSAEGVDQYENVTVVETYSGSNDTITVTFNNAGCQQPEQTAR